MEKQVIKGFIEVTAKEYLSDGRMQRTVIETKVYCHYSQIYFKYKSCYFMDKTLKETYEEVIQLIQESLNEDKLKQYQ